MQYLEIFADGYLGSLELTGEFGDEHSSLMVQQIENGAAAFFVQQENRPAVASDICARVAARISFYSV